MDGKLKCRKLSMIRFKIAWLNGIKYDDEPCHHDGDCSGTCPKCEQQAAYIMNELRKREKQGLPIKIDADIINKLFNVSYSESIEEDLKRKRQEQYERHLGGYISSSKTK